MVKSVLRSPGVQELVLRNARLSKSQAEELQKSCENRIFRLINLQAAISANESIDINNLPRT
jgi:hypothetical protein